MEARTGKYFQVILPKDLHTAPEEIQYASLDVLTHAATLELVTSTTSQNSVINTLELARYQLSHYTLLCKAQANHIITQNKRDTQIWCGSAKPTPQNFIIKYWGLQPLIKHTLKYQNPNDNQEITHNKIPH